MKKPICVCMLCALCICLYQHLDGCKICIDKEGNVQKPAFIEHNTGTIASAPETHKSSS